MLGLFQIFIKSPVLQIHRVYTIVLCWPVFIRFGFTEGRLYLVPQNLYVSMSGRDLFQDHDIDGGLCNRSLCFNMDCNSSDQKIVVHLQSQVIPFRSKDDIIVDFCLVV